MGDTGHGVDGSPAAGSGRAGGWPIARRLLLPLALIAVVFYAATIFFIVSTISSRMDREIDARLAGLTETLTRSGLALDGELLSRVRALTGLEVVVVSGDGEIDATTLDDGRARELLARIDRDQREWRDPVSGDRYRLATGRLAVAGPGPPASLVVAASTATTDRLGRDLALTVTVVTGAALLVALLIGHFVSRTVTRPLRDLADMARRVGRGDLARAAPRGGGREIDTLARELDGMLGELARSREELVRSEKLTAAGKMAASVAHEIRNPLSAIRMNIQLLLERSEGGDGGAPELREALEELDRLDLGLGNLLDLTRPPRFLPEPGDVSEVVRSTVGLTSRKLRHLGVVVRADLDQELPPVSLDRYKAKQAFLNVILNAAEAMPGGGLLRIAARRDNDHVEVCFEDNGVGIEGHDAGRLFEPFYSTKPGGAGLGLHIVRNIMELHGGEVRLAAAEPRGVRCALTFPLVRTVRRKRSLAARGERA